MKTLKTDRKFRVSLRLAGKSLFLSALALCACCASVQADPTIVTNISPLNLQVPPGYAVTYSVAATGTAPLYYQWYSNATAILNATNSSYQFSAAVGTNTYSCLVSNSVSTAASSTATVSAEATAPLVTFGNFSNWQMQGSGITSANGVLQLTDGHNSEGSSAFYMIPQYIEGFTASFVYYPSPPGGHTPQTGASVNLADGTCFVMQNAAAGATALGAGGGDLGYTGITNSTALELNIYPGATIGMAFDTNGSIGPNSVTGNVDLDAADPIGVTLYYNYAAGQMTVTLVDQVMLTAYTNTLTVGSLTNSVKNPQNPGVAYIGFTAGTGGANSVQQISNFVFSYSLPGQPVITQVPPASVNTNQGSTVTFTTAASGTGLVYQWYDINGNPLSTNAAVTLTNVQASQAGTYTVVVSNSVGGSSATASLAVSTGAPNVISDIAPLQVNRYVGNQVTFSFAVSGDAPTYTWLLNGLPIAGATGASYTFPVLSGQNTYECEVTNDASDNSYTYSSQATVTGVAVPTDSYGQTVLSDQPVSYWRLNESAGSPVAYDLVNGNNGTPAGGTTFGLTGTSDGGSGTCVGFNGTSGRIIVPYAVGLNAPHYSLETWVLFNAVDTGTYVSPITSRNTGNGDLGYIFYMNPSGTLMYWQGGIDSAGFNEISGPAAKANVWTHLVGTWDGSTMRYYVNGVQVGTAVPTDNPKPISQGWSEPVTFGAGESELAAGGYWLNGSMSEVAYYNYPLSAARIQAHYLVATNAPNITQEPTNAVTINEGSTLTLTATVTGAQPLSYQWTSNNVAIGGQTNLTLVLSNVPGSMSGDTLTLVVTNAYGSDQSFGTLLTVISGGPQIVSAVLPSSLSLYLGVPVTYSVVAEGTVPFYYQWFKNGTSVLGATNSSYTFATPAGTNQYYVTISNNYAGGSMTLSDTSTLTSVPVPTAPYAATIFAANPIAYWRLDETNGSSTAYDYMGGHDGTYSEVQLGVPGYSPFDPDTAAEFGPLAGYASYSYMQENDNTPSDGVPLIDFAPQGANVELSVEAWVNGPIGQNSSGSAIIAKGNSGSDEFLLDASAPGGKFRFYIREAGGSNPTIFSSVGPDGNWHHLVGVCDEANGNMYLYVDGNVNGVISGISGLGMYESTVPVSVGAQSIGGGYTYQFNGTIDEVSLYNYALSPSQVQAHYNAAPESPYFTVEPPTNVVGYLGEKVTLSATVLGSAPMTNQWLVNASSMPGQTNVFLLLTNLVTGTNTYVLKVSNVYGTTNTAGTTVQIPAGSGPPVLVTDLQPLSNSIYAGEPFTYSVTVSGQEPLFYQWFFESQPVSGATNSSYAIPSLATTNTGDYYCLISNSISSISSSTATLVVVSQPGNPYALRVMADNPVAYYRLDETNGSLIGYDYVGGNNGAYSNTASILHVPGCFGALYDDDTAAYFGTNNDQNTFLGATITNVDFSVPNGANGAFSVEAWAKGPTGVNQLSGGGIVAKGVGNGDEQFALDAHSGFRFYVRNAFSATSVAAAQAAGNIGGSVVSGNWQMDGNWHHLVGVCDQAHNNVLLYVDGSLIGPNIITNGVVPALAISLDMGHNGSTGTNGEIYPLEGIHEPADVGSAYWNANSVSIGTRNNNSGSAGYTLNFQGAVDEVALYNYTLSPLQVSNHYAVAKDLPVPLYLQVTNGQTVLTWSAGAWVTATLQSATNIAGPWTPVAGATSPYPISTSGAARFYRVRLF